jgi:hypothetical protein
MDKDYKVINPKEWPKPIPFSEFLGIRQIVWIDRF